MLSLNKKHAARVAALVVLCAPVLACTQPNYLNYADRTDTVTFQAGDAVAFNRQLQYENPWPRHARQTHIHTDGEKMDLAIDRYKSDQTKQTEAVATGGGSGS